MIETKAVYSEALKNRRAGVASELGASATFTEVKPDFYADARILSEDALRVFDDMQEQFPPYGLMVGNGEPLQNLQDTFGPWSALYGALATTGHYVMEEARPSTPSCPYHEVLKRTLGGTRRPLEPYDNDEFGLDTLRDVTTPGAELNAPLFVSLIRRLPAIQKLHGSSSDPEAFARNSVSLLREPLAHPQQWAAAFVYSLGKLTELVQPTFLNDTLASSYTKIEAVSDGRERLAWAIPTEEFTIRQNVLVVDRTLGSETDRTGAHVTTYPTGTKLKDIRVDEPSIGCPGDQLARAMWSRIIDVAVGEKLWEQDLTQN